MKIQITSTKIINWICMLMILVMIVLLFTPYFTYETKEKNPETGKREEVTKVISINDYVWFPRDHKDMTAQFEDLYEDIYGNPPKGATKEEKEAWPKFWINDMVTAPALTLFLGIAVGIISLFYSSKPFTSLLALILGGLSTYSYATMPEYGLGNPMPLIIVSSITAVIGLFGIVWFFIRTAKKTAV